MYARLEPVLGNKRPLLRIAATLATLLISVGILGYLIYSQRDLLADFELQINPIPLLAAAIFFSFDLFLVAFIWGWIFNSLGEPLKISKHIRIFTISNLAKRIPGTVWYIASRAEFYSRIGTSRRLTTVASGVEFAIALLTSGIVALVFAFSVLTENQLSLFGIALVILLSLLVSQPRFINWIFKKINIDAKGFSSWKVLQWMVSYLGTWVLSGVVVFFISLSFFDLDLADLGYVIGSVALTNVITAALFFAPSNFGITEVSLSVLLSRIMPTPYAIIISIATRVIILALEAFWAIVFIWLDR